MINEQHTSAKGCRFDIIRRIFYAKEFVSGDSFYGADGVCDGVRMICYNIALNMGGMSNAVFLKAFHELVIMAPIAFVLDFFAVGKIAKKKAFSIVDVRKD